MISRTDVEDRILAFAAESPNKIITGGRLSELLKHTFPGFNPAEYGVKNIRAFVQDYLPGRLLEVGRVGTDILYGIPGATAAQSPSRPGPNDGSISPEVLRVLKSPNSPLELHANRDTGEIRILEAGSDAQEPWVKLKATTPAILLQIARDFVASVPDESQRVSMTQIIDQSPGAWWLRVWPYMQQHGLSGQWLAFRNRRLVSRLQTELHDLGIRTAEISIHALAPTHRQSDSQRREDTLPESKQSEEALRDAVVSVVKNLPLSELRNLRLPVGELFDTITKRR
jgi:hypothetical protein